MELEITTNHQRIQSRLDDLTTEQNRSDIAKIKKRCEGVYLDILVHLNNGTLKKTQIDCFNWFDIYIKILEHEILIYISKIRLDFEEKIQRKKSGAFSKSSRDYIIAQNNNRIYRIISKPIDMVNNSVDYDFYLDFCILDIVEDFETDALSNMYFPYRPQKTELILVFVETPSDEVCQEIKNKNMIPVSMNELNLLKPIPSSETANIDVNIVIALCSGLVDLSPDSDMIQQIISQKIFIGYNANELSKLDNKKLCEFIKKQKKELLEEINSHQKIIMCQNVIDEAERIIGTYGSGEEKEALQKLKDLINYQVVPNGDYDLIDKYQKNSARKYNDVEKNAMKTGYVNDAMTLTSNHRYIEFLLSKNIYIEAKFIPSLNLLYKVQQSLIYRETLSPKRKSELEKIS